MFKSAVLCAALVLGSVGGASAATIDFDSVAPDLTTQGFQLSYARIVGGPCADAPCLALNDHETTTITRVGGGLFSLATLWFKLVGNGTANALAVTSTGPAGQVIFARPEYDKNVGYVVDLLAFFTNVTSISFTTPADGGNVRIDDIALTVPAAVPVPAAAGLMALALGGLGLAGRRKKA